MGDIISNWLFSFVNSPLDNIRLFRQQFGIEGMVDLATFQSLDSVFNNVREVGEGAVLTAADVTLLHCSAVLTVV